MKLYDTHCHLNADTLYPNIDQWVKEALQEGVVGMNVIGWDKPSSELAIRIADQYPMCHAVIGLHPVNEDLLNPYHVQWITELVTRSKVVAIGEIGLDYYWKKDHKDQQDQTTVFIKQIHLANQLKLPIVVHCRDAYEDTLRILKDHPPRLGGVMHCYAGPIELVHSFIELGMMIALGGPITFKKNQETRNIAKMIDLTKLLIETDAPYLSPEPFRGQTNTPSRVRLVFDEVVKQRNETHEIIEKQLILNSQKLFHVK